jgi:hypothetical protein
MHKTHFSSVSESLVHTLPSFWAPARLHGSMRLAINVPGGTGRYAMLSPRRARVAGGDGTREGAQFVDVRDVLVAVDFMILVMVAGYHS